MLSLTSDRLSISQTAYDNVLEKTCGYLIGKGSTGQVASTLILVSQSLHDFMDVSSHKKCFDVACQ